MNLIDEPCPFCHNKQTEIMGIAGVGTNHSKSIYGCPKCRCQHYRKRTPKEQKKTHEYLLTDDELLAKAKENEDGPN